MLEVEDWATQGPYDLIREDINYEKITRDEDPDPVGSVDFGPPDPEYEYIFFFILI